jgi:hypothetical protein
VESILQALGRFGDFAGTSLATMVAAFKEALEKAEKAGYERGFADGKKAAIIDLAALKSQVTEAIDRMVGAGITEPLDGAANFRGEIVARIRAAALAETAATRAKRGSVAPSVLEALNTSQRGLSPREVADKAKIPENSARGSLNKMRQDGTVEKRGSLWFLVKKEEVADPLWGPATRKESIFD